MGVIPSIRNILLVLIAIFAAWPVTAQEIFVNGGFSDDASTGTSSGHWSVAYFQDLADHAMFSISYLNEGHQPNHYRDGLAPQIWGRASPFGRELSFAVGVGPYLYFDTKVETESDAYENKHGLGFISSGTATWYGLSPFLLQIRADYIGAPGSFDSFSTSFGIGFVLDDKPAQGSAPSSRGGRGEAKNEIGLYIGKAVLNSARSEQGNAMSVEYRRNLFHHLDWTFAWLNEGDTLPLGRYGVISELWAVQGFFDERLAMGIGAGPYLARDKYDGDDGQRTTLAGLVSMTAVFRFTPWLGFRVIFHRVVTDYSRDTDVFTGGITISF